MTFEARCDRALASLLLQTDTSQEWHVADRAVTLHCLQAVAPRFFERHRLAPVLDAALDGLARVPSTFPAGLEWEQTMARLDAHYFRVLHGLPTTPLQEAELRDRIAEAAEVSVLVGWLLAELAGSLGIDVEVPDPTGLTGGERIYWRTHQILLWTSYLRDPLEVDASGALDELERGLSLRLAGGQLDAAAEAMFCLRAGGRRVEPALLEALAGQQRDDGSFVEPGEEDPRTNAHCTAVCLIALASGAATANEDREAEAEP